MPKNLNLITKTFYLSATAKASERKAIGSSVAASMTRYVTFVRVSKRATGAVSHGSKVYFVSTTASNAASTAATASAGAKILIRLQSGAASHMIAKTKQVPDIPDTENPLFTIASSKWLTAYLASAATMSGPVQCTVQYYDQ